MLQPLSDLYHTITYNIEKDSDLAHIYTDKYYFIISVSGLDHLRYGLNAHYRHTELLFGFSDEELTILQKKRPKRDFMAEIDYQIERKSYNGKIIQASDLISRLPFSSQSRNRNGKQNIADSRWKKAIKEENSDVLRLIEYYAEEESVICTKFPHVKWTKGSFAISPCHIYPAKKDRGEDSWTSEKILRDLSIVNKVFDKISASKLGGKHAINSEDALVAIEYLDNHQWDTLSISRQVLYVLLQRRISQNFYENYKITDLDLNI
jgi:hypothetical protein